MRTDRVVSEVLGEEHALTPSDLYNAELKTNLVGGYSKNQVDALLERTADVLEHLITRNRQLKQQTEEQHDEIEKLRDMEDSLRSALVSSQKMSENIIASARFQADALLEEAKLARARAMFQMEQLPDALRGEIQLLKETRERLRADIAAMLKAHETLLADVPRAEDAEEAARHEEEKRSFVSLHVEDAEVNEEHAPQAADNDEDANEPAQDRETDATYKESGKNAEI